MSAVSENAEQESGPGNSQQRSQVEPPQWHEIKDSPQWQDAVTQNPSLAPFFDNLESFVELPEGVGKLREMFLQLAVCGDLLPQNPNDEPASELVKRISAEREALIADKTVKRSEPLPDLVYEDLPFDPPHGWAFERMGNLFRFIDYRGKTPKKVSSGVRLITAKNIRMGFLKRDPEEFVSVETYHEWMTRGFPEVGDLLFTTEAPMGNVCEVELTEPFALAQRTINLNPHADQCSKYMMFAIMSRTVQRLIEELATGMTAKGIKAAKLRLVPIPLPPLAEQRRIVSKVEELMSLCDTLESQRRARESVRARASLSVLASLTSAPRSVSTNKQPKAAGDREASGEETLAGAWQRLSDHFEILLDQPETHAQLRQAILQLAVQGKLVPLTDEDTELLNRETVVGDYLKMQNGYAFKSQWFEKNGIRLIRNANIGHGTLDWSDVAKISEERAEEYERFRMVEGDIVLALDRPLITTGLKVARVTSKDLPSLLLQRVARPVFDEDSNLRPDYFFTWLQSPFFIDSINPGKSNGVPHISTREVEKIEFAPPSEHTQKRIVLKVSIVLSHLDQATQLLKTRLERTEYLMDSLIDQILGIENEETMGSEDTGKTQPPPPVKTDRLKSAKEQISSAEELVELFEHKGDQATPDQLLSASRLTAEVDLFFQLLREARDSGKLKFSEGLNQPIRRVE